NGLTSELIEGTLKTAQILRLSENDDVDVAAEFGGAVQDARLPAHEQGAHAVFPQSRKDFANRARAQGSLPGPSTLPRGGPIRRSAGPASSPTTPGPRDRPAARNEEREPLHLFSSARLPSAMP